MRNGKALEPEYSDASFGQLINRRATHTADAYDYDVVHFMLYQRYIPLTPGSRRRLPVCLVDASMLTSRTR